MALDAGLAIVDAIRFWGQVAAQNADFAAVGTAVNYADVYMTWTIQALRLLIWALALGTLSRLTKLRPSFQKARLWYLLRFLTCIAEFLPEAVVQYRHTNLTSDPNWFILIAFALLLSLGAILLGESVLLPMSSRAILFAAAELSDLFGMEIQARKNRRCANALVIISVTFVFLVSLAIGLVVVYVAKGVSLYRPEDEASAALLLLELAAVLLSAPAGIASLVYRFLAAVRLRRTYGAIEELMK